MKKLFTIICLLFIFTNIIAGNILINVNEVGPQPNHKVALYPNPVSNDVLKVVGEDIQSIEMLNVIGQKITGWEQTRTNAREILIKFDNIEKGMYLIKFTFTDGISVIKKIMIK